MSLPVAAKATREGSLYGHQAAVKTCIWEVATNDPHCYQRIMDDCGVLTTSKPTLDRSALATRRTSLRPPTEKLEVGEAHAVAHGSAKGSRSTRRAADTSLRWSTVQASAVKHPTAAAARRRPDAPAEGATEL